MVSGLFPANVVLYYIIYPLLSSTSVGALFKKFSLISINLVVFYFVVSSSSDKDADTISVGGRGPTFYGFVDDVFGQDLTTVNGSNSKSESTSSNPNLQTLNMTTPILSRTSHNNIYEVQLLWSVPQNLQSPNILPEDDGFDIQIQFLDANASDPSNRNISVHNMISDELQPTPVIDPLLPVSNYDLTIFSEEGDILWQQDDIAPTGGRSVERVILDDPYQGKITISITDIRSPQNDNVDSVQFPAKLD